MRDDLDPNIIHMFLCALIPLSVIFILHRGFHLDFGTAAVLGFLSGIVATLTIAPLTFWIYSLLAKKYNPNAVCHTTDAGCSSLVFVLVVLLIYFTITTSLERREKKLKKQDVTRQYRMNGAR